ncbi:MAG: hypothetical protein KM296_00490 [Brockia lithotrophica]|nr:hypothetical protein [Brockia lithotrophica]
MDLNSRREEFESLLEEYEELEGDVVEAIRYLEELSELMDRFHERLSSHLESLTGGAEAETEEARSEQTQKSKNTPRTQYVRYKQQEAQKPAERQVNARVNTRVNTQRASSVDKEFKGVFERIRDIHGGNAQEIVLRDLEDENKFWRFRPDFRNRDAIMDVIAGLEPGDVVSGVFTVVTNKEGKKIWVAKTIQKESFEQNLSF